MTDKPYITVITSTYNAASTLRRCLDSVRFQTFSNIEHIIIDGASTDGTKDIIAEYASKKDSKISYWISEPDNGIYDAWNKALPYINGEWFYFLGGDDKLNDCNVLNKVVNELIKIDKSVEIAYGNVISMDVDYRKVISINATPWSRKYKHEFITGKKLFAEQGVFHRTRMLDKYGYYDLKYFIVADNDLLYKSVLNVNPHYMNINVAIFCVDGLSCNTDIFLQRATEIQDIIHKNNQNSLYIDLQCYILKLIQHINPYLRNRILKNAQKFYAKVYLK